MPYWAVPDYAALLEGLIAACKAGGERALQIRPGMKVETKPDGSIVTDADMAVEADVRDWIAIATPGAAVWGEEFGYEPPNENGFWMIDPVDGTSNFAFGQPLWGVTAAYYHDGALQVGVIRLPELDWTIAATRGGGATINGKTLSPVRCGPIQRFELVGYGDETAASKHGYPGKVRHIGSYVVEAALFATGGLRALVSDKVCLYDAAAGITIARELGAEVRELDGSKFTESEWTRPVICRPFGLFPPDSGWPFQSQ